MGLRGPKPEGKIKLNWTPNFAYAIGLIATDGCLSKDGRHITFVSKEKEQISNFKSCLGLTVKTGITTSGYKDNKAFRVQFGDVLFYQFMQKMGLTHAKSLTMGELLIPDIYFFDFLRGCLDGDGCSYSYWDPRWKSSFMFYIGFASGSIKFLTWLRATINRLANLQGHISTHKKKEGKNNFYQLKYAKYEAMKLVKLMYYTKSCIKLSRKYLKIKRSLDIVRTHKGVVFVR